MPFRQAEVDIDFDILAGPLVALVGGNGSGKSHLLNLSGPAVLYREMRDYEEPTADHVAPGVRDAMAELEFSIGTERYRAILQIDPQAAGGRGKSEAYLLKRTGAEEYTPLAGPSLRAYDEAISGILPPADLFYASVFAAQGGGGSFFQLAKAQRKDLFASMLDLETLSGISATAKEKGGVLEALVPDVRGRIKAATFEIETLAAFVMQVGELESVVMQHSLRVDAQEDAVEAARAALAKEQGRLAVAEERAEAAAREETRINAERVDACDALRAKQQTVVDLEAMLGRSGMVAKAVERLAEVDESLTLHREHERAAMERLAGYQEQAEKHGHEATELKVRAGMLQHKLGLIEIKREQMQTRQNELTRRALLLDEIPGVPACETCPLTEDARQARAKLEAEQHDDEDDQRGGLEADWKQVLADGEATRVKLEALRVETADATRFAKDITVAIVRLEREKRDLAALAGRASEIAAARARLEVAQAAVVEAKARAEAAVAKGQDPESFALDEKRRDVIRAQDELGTLEEHRLELVRELRSAEATLANRRGRLEAMGDPAGKFAAAKADEARLLEEATDWALLAKALGRDGVQALAIDAAGPAVTAIANDLLSNCYGPRFTIALETTALKKDGGQKETFDIRILDGEAGREARKCSGGETVLIDEALRLALAIYNASRSGVELRTLWRDETAGALSPENADRYVAMLRRAAEVGGFHQVLFVAHQADVWQQADAQLLVEGGQVTIA